MKRLVVMAVPALMLLAACSSGSVSSPEDGAATSSSPDSSSSADASESASAADAAAGPGGEISEMWHWEGHPTSPVNEEGDVVVFFALGSNNKEQLIALDAQSGQQLWAKKKVARTMEPIRDAYFTPRLNHAPVVIDDVVYYAYEARTDRAKDLVVGVDLHTGKQVVRTKSSPGAVGGVYSCGDEGAETPCFQAWDKKDQRQTYDLKPDGTWSVRKAKDDDVDIDWDRKAVTVNKDGKQVGTFLLKNIIGAQTAKDLYATNTQLVTADGRDIVVLSALPVKAKDKTGGDTLLRMDYGPSVTVGFDATTGEVLWQRDGVGFCPNGRSQKLDPTDQDSEYAVIRCAVTGIATGNIYRQNTPLGVRLSDDFDVTLKRLDPLTGADMWSHNLGATKMLAQAPQDSVGSTTDLRASETAEAFTVTENGSVTLDIVDMLTGESRKATPSDRFVCSQPESTRTASAWYVNGAPDNTLTMWTGYPCSWPGKPTAEGDFAEALASSDPEDQAPYYFVSLDGVTAYDWVKDGSA